MGAPTRDVRYDVGVAVLDQPVRMATYGALPDADLVDTLKEGKRLTVVGYGATGYEIGGGPQPQPVYPEDRNRATVRLLDTCLLYTSPSPRDMRRSRMPSSA